MCFAFVFDQHSSIEREDLNKFTIKDMREQMKDIELVKKRIEVTFDVTCVISLLTILPFQGLIEREYMKRSDHDRKLYIYLVVSGG